MTPSIVSDGNFAVASVDDVSQPYFPFADKGDSATFIYKVRRKVNATDFVAPTQLQSLSFPLGTGYLVNISPTEKDTGGLLAWTEDYARLPATRREGTTITYSQQWIRALLTVPVGIAEFTATRNATILYEYFFGSNPPDFGSPNQAGAIGFGITGIPVIVAPKLTFMDNVLYIRGGWGTFEDGQEIDAQDSSTEIWMGQIYVRKRILIKFQTRIPYV